MKLSILTSQQYLLHGRTRSHRSSRSAMPPLAQACDEIIECLCVRQTSMHNTVRSRTSNKSASKLTRQERSSTSIPKVMKECIGFNPLCPWPRAYCKKPKTVSAVLTFNASISALCPSALNQLPVLCIAGDGLLWKQRDIVSAHNSTSSVLSVLC